MRWRTTTRRIRFAEFTPLAFNGLPTAAAACDAHVVQCDPAGVRLLGRRRHAGRPQHRLHRGQRHAQPATTRTLPLGRRAQAFLRSTAAARTTPGRASLRGVVGLDGTFGDNWTYSANLTASEFGLTRDQSNYMIPQRIMDVVARGQFNFNDPDANTQETCGTTSLRKSSVYSMSKLWQAQGTIGKELVRPARRPACRRHSALRIAKNRSTRRAPTRPTMRHPYSRYYSINAVGTAGERDVKSAFFEISAPILKQIELMASGRYDEYSTGQSNFSPKFGVKFTPIEMLAIRGTWSEGFRIPSFNEAFGLPTTGYVTRAR